MSQLSRDWFQKHHFTQESFLAFKHCLERSGRLDTYGMVLTELLLWSMLRWEEDFGVLLLCDCGVDQWTLEMHLHEQLRNRTALGTFTEVMEPIARSAVREADALNQQWVGTEHIMLALLAMDDERLTGLFAKFGVTYDQYKNKLIELERSWQKQADEK